MMQGPSTRIESGLAMLGETGESWSAVLSRVITNVTVLGSWSGDGIILFQ
jgi:hypothetical protein